MRSHGELANIVPPINPEKGKMPYEWKPSILLYTHLLHNPVPPEKVPDLMKVMKLSPFLLDQMIDTGMEIDILYKQRRIPKRVGMMPIYLMILMR